MQRKYILCTWNGDFCLLFISILLNSAYGWTAQNLVINSKKSFQRIFFELLYRVYKTPKFWESVLYECPSPSLLGYPFDDPFPNNMHMLSSIPQYQKRRKFFCFVWYLRKSLSLTFLFSDSHVGADKPGGQCLKHNVWDWTYSWAVVGTTFLPWLKPKQSSKRCSHRHFSKYLPNNFRTPSNHYKNYAKICFAA